MSGAGPALHPGELPSWSVFQFPPDPYPPPVPPPYDGEPTFANPFAIPADLYQGALSWQVPLTIALVYATVVTYFNWYNRQHGNKPWRIAKTRPFFAFVIFHNVLLAVYSAVTCVAMVRALKHSIPHYTEPNAVVGTVDALCKIHGPRGLGDAVTFNPSSNTWGSLNSNIFLGHSGLPDNTDVGRIWNEGLAFWGWWFYLSKFYEVLDTAIILAKGKRSTTLQKYHHAGAMLSMWAGMRFMSPPIWMFVLVNSGIHAMMYTYYTLSALGFRVPNIVKRTLTTLQITQFLVGSTFAALHLFINYTVPVTTAHKIVEKVASSVNPSSASSAVSSATSVAAAALPTASGAAVAFIRKLIYRAAGDEGLAENIPVPGVPLPYQYQPNLTADTGKAHPIGNFLRHETVDRIIHRTEYKTVPCIDTSGQAFAIYVNLFYLFPLTVLFMRFFFKSYLRRASPAQKKSGTPQPAAQKLADASRDATHDVQREFEALDRKVEDGLSTAVNKSKDAILRGRKTVASSANGHVKDERDRHTSLSPANKKFVDSVTRKVSKRLQEIDEGTESERGRAKDVARELAESAKKGGKQNGVKKEAGPEAEHDETRTGPMVSDAGPTDEQVAKPESEPEPKDLNNTLDQGEGKGLF